MVAIARTPIPTEVVNAYAKGQNRYVQMIQRSRPIQYDYRL
jgi:acyl-homoserine lactone acylase PvdQ